MGVYIIVQQTLEKDKILSENGYLSFKMFGAIVLLL